MNGMPSLLLLSVPGLPLLLAIPALRLRLPWLALLALLPAIVLLFTPEDLSTELPWMLLGGVGLRIDTVSRWWLTMSVVMWLVAATLLYSPGDHGAGSGRLMPWFLLSLAGQLGSILATDTVSFLAFSSLMGYAFYGLLAVNGDEAARRAGRVYLVMLILADIVLFEALLIAAAATEDLRFASIADEMALSSSAGFYLSMVIVGFALKAGFWPLHVWLPLAYGSGRPAVGLLLWTGPVATGLLGIVRWLPLGESTAPVLGTLLQGLGVTAILYAVLLWLWWAQRGRRTAYAIISATGAFATAFGTGLADPVFWEQYESLVPFIIASVGWGLTTLTIGIVWGERRRTRPAVARVPADDGAPWFERWTGALVRWGRRMGLDVLPGMRAAWLAKSRNLWPTHTWQRVFDAGEHFLRSWASAIALFLLLAMLMTFVGIGGSWSE